MPSLNFDYTQFLKKQNALYLLKYQNDPIETPSNPTPIIGYSGYVPTYRSSIHDLRMVRSLVRCLTSPTKPTTANGFESSVSRLPVLERPATVAAQRSIENAPEVTKINDQEIKDHKVRAQTAPTRKRSESKHEINISRPTSQAEKKQEHVKLQSTTKNVNDRPIPSQISMLSAGTSDYISNDMWMKPYSSSGSSKPHPVPPSRQQSARVEKRPASQASSVAERPMTRLPAQKHPSGYAQTLYGSSFRYAWPDTTPKAAIVNRRNSYEEDRKLNRNDNVIYHKHEGVVPKYMGYVPGYKFRHGSTYGVLTSHATDLGVALRRGMQAK